MSLTDHEEPLAAVQAADTPDVQSPPLAPASDAPAGLQQEHSAAIQRLEVLRRSPGQLTTGINAKVGAVTLEAGRCALNVPEHHQQFVVAAPPGTGKTSHATALLTACVRSGA